MGRKDGIVEVMDLDYLPVGIFGNEGRKDGGYAIRVPAVQQKKKPKFCALIRISGFFLIIIFLGQAKYVAG